MAANVWMILRWNTNAQLAQWVTATDGAGNNTASIYRYTPNHWAWTHDVTYASEFPSQAVAQATLDSIGDPTASVVPTTAFTYWATNNGAWSPGSAHSGPLVQP